MLKLYYTEAALPASAQEALLSFLSPVRRELVLRRAAHDRTTAAMAELLLRYALMHSPYAAHTDAEILWDGKPRFADGGLGLSFNLSHVGAGRGDRDCGGFAAVLLSDEGMCGVDMELPREIRNREALIRKLCCAAEQEYLAQREPEAFFDVWCAKEAFVKYTGEGFSRPLSTALTDVSAGAAISSDGAVRCALKVFRARGLILCAAAEEIPASLTAEYICVEDVLHACLQFRAGSDQPKKG